VAAAFANHPNATLLVQMTGGTTGLAFALSSPLTRFLIERYGYRDVNLISVKTFAVIGIAPAVLDSLPLIMATRRVLGVTVAGAITAGITGLAPLLAKIRPGCLGATPLSPASVRRSASHPPVNSRGSIGAHLSCCIS
jgi:MFS family permease